MDRIFALVWPRYLERGSRTKDTVVFVMSAGDGLLEKHIELVRESREVQGTYSTASLRRLSMLLPNPGRFSRQG